jgi:hypothetical protein
MDDTSLLYAVMEPADADLGQILRERALTVAETRQLAVSLVAALQALHAAKLIHEHIQPINILAVGETIKLRSDCIREAPHDAEGDSLRARDLRDLALVLLQALTLDRNPDRVLKPAPNSPSLPAPFREIIFNAIGSRWTLAQIAKALDDSAPVLVSTPAPAPVATQAAPHAPARTADSAVRPAPTPIETAPTPAPVSAQSSSNGTSATPATMPKPRTTPALPASAARIRVESGWSADHATDSEKADRRPLIRAVAAIATLFVLVMVLWRVTHRHPATPPPVQTLASIGQPQTSDVSKPSATEPKPFAGAPQRPMAASAPVVRPIAATTASPAGASNLHWRVIAFTYNRADQAQTKAGRLAQRNPDLHFDVFSPRGHAPYLVCVSGFMSQEDAFALRDKLRGRGFPHDIYAQNYGGR